MAIIKGSTLVVHEGMPTPHLQEQVVRGIEGALPVPACTYAAAHRILSGKHCHEAVILHSVAFTPAEALILLDDLLHSPRAA